MKRKIFGVVDLKKKLKCEQSVLVEYYIVEEEKSDENYDEQKPYGIEVMKKQIIDGVTYREIKTVRNISDSSEQVAKLLDILKRNSVTPITVADVLEDLSVK